MAATAVFYHLSRSGLEETVLMIVTRALAQGWRVMLRAGDAALLERLDSRMWLGDESFLPHGMQGGPHDADQPVLLGQGAIANGAAGLILLAGAAVTQAEAAGLQRVWLLFDGGDEAAVAAARDQWRQITGWGLAAQYWSDEGGSWVKKTEKAAARV